jgi:hypothetical protein
VYIKQLPRITSPTITRHTSRARARLWIRCLLRRRRNIRIFTELDFTFVTSSSQAQRLAKIFLERQRRQKQLTAACTALCYQVAPPEVISVTHAGLNLSSDTFEVTDVQLAVEQSKALSDEAQQAPVLVTMSDASRV